VSLFLPLLGNLSRLRPKGLLPCQGQTPIPSPSVIVVVSAALWGRVDLPVCLGEVNDVLVTSDSSGSLLAGRALERAAFAARCGRNLVDEMFYPGHLPGGVEGERK